MTTQIKITQLTDIGSANLAVTTLLPVVNMAGVPTTQKTTLGNLANVILSQSGSNFARVALANLSYAVSNAAQPNITSTGTLTSLSVSGNANIGNIGTAGLITATGNVGAGNLNTTGLVNAGTLSVTGTTNLGAVGNVTITGGTNGQVLTTNGSNVLSWTTVSSGSSNTAVTVTANAQPNITSVGNLSYLIVNGNLDATNIDAANTVYANYFVGDGSSITDIDAINVIGNVANANYSTYAGTVITGAQPNITSVGNLASLTITGVTTLGNVTNLGDVGNVKIDGGIDGDVLGTDGANLFWVAQTDIGNFSFSNNIISLNVPANLVINSDGQNFIVNANSRLFTYKPDGTFVLPGGSEMFESSGNLNMISGGLILSMGPNANSHSHWQFSGDGNLTLPGNLNFSGGGIVQTPMEDFDILVQDSDDDGWQITQTIDAGDGNIWARTRLQRDQYSVNIQGKQWTFNNNGDFNLGGNIRGDYGVDSNISVTNTGSTGSLNLQAISYIGDTLISNVLISNPNVSISTSNAAHTWTFGDTGLLTFPGTPRIDTGANNFEVQAAEAINFEANTVVNIYTDTSNNALQWQFDDTGNTIFPGHLNYTGMASPAPSINGFSSANFALSVIGDQVKLSDNAISTVGGSSNLILNTAYGSTTDSFIQVPAFQDGGEELIIKNGYGGSATGVKIQTETGNFTFIGNTLTLPGDLVANGNGHISANTASFSGNISAGAITANGKIGYSTGGNATQTSTGQGVTINQLTGLVTLANRTYNAGDLEAFAISCNKVSNDDFVLVQMVDSVNAPSYNVVAYPNFAVANTISVLVRTLVTVGTDTPILKFMIVKSPTA